MLVKTVRGSEQQCEAVDWGNRDLPWLSLRFPFWRPDFAHLADEIAAGTEGGGTIVPCGRDGWALCAEHHVWAAGGEGDSAADESCRWTVT